MSTVYSKIFVKRGYGDPSTSLNLGEFGIDVCTNVLYMGMGVGIEPMLVYTANCIKLTYDDIANVPVVDDSSVAAWNTFFDLPDNVITGYQFIDVKVYGNVVKLYAPTGTKIYLKNYLFDTAESVNLLGFEDDGGIVSIIGTGSFTTNTEATACINLTTVSFAGAITVGTIGFNGNVSLTNVNFPVLTTANPGAFASCYSLVNPNFPALTIANDGAFLNCVSLYNPNFPVLTTVGDNCFANCDSYANINLPSVTTLGSSTGYCAVFSGIQSLSINLRILPILMTCDSSNPDGDILSLQGTNDVSIYLNGIYVG